MKLNIRMIIILITVIMLVPLYGNAQSRMPDTSRDVEVDSARDDSGSAWERFLQIFRGAEPEAKPDIKARPAEGRDVDTVNIPEGRRAAAKTFRGMNLRDSSRFWENVEVVKEYKRSGGSLEGLMQEFGFTRAEIPSLLSSRYSNIMKKAFESGRVSFEHKFVVFIEPMQVGQTFGQLKKLYLSSPKKGEVEVLDADYENMLPRVSRLGDIAYVCGKDICLIKADGSNAKNITSNWDQAGSYVQFVDPNWDAEGGKLVFVGITPNHSSDLIKYQVHVTAKAEPDVMEVIIDEICVWKFHPQWAFIKSDAIEGEVIVHECSKTPSGDSWHTMLTAEEDSLKMDLIFVGIQLWMITEDALEPSFSPVDPMIILVGRGTAQGQTEELHLKFEMPENHLITSPTYDPSLNPVFSMDGKKVAYVAKDSEEDTNYRLRLWSVSSEPPWDNQTIAESVNARTPIPYENNSFIFVEMGDGSSHSMLKMLNFQTGEVITLTDGTFSAIQPAVPSDYNYGSISYHQIAPGFAVADW